jgi:inhibitor of KinA sporulation pathway (predicted exonuclease)
MNLLSLDLEMNKPSGKIIQIGACVFNTISKQIVDTFCVHINPDEKLSEFIINLTGIEQEDVDRGLTLLEGYEQLKKFKEHYQCFMNPVTWGGGDSQEIYKQLGHVENWAFGRRWIDVKTLYVTHRISNNKPVSGGLSKAMTKYGLQFKGRKHNAKDDAVNTALLYLHFLESFKKFIDIKQ